MSEPNQEDVGYRRPPKRHRFQKGQSGNPRGRPRRDDNLLLRVGELMQMRVKASDGTSMSHTEVLVRMLFKDAAQGRPKAFAEFLRLAQRTRLLRAAPIEERARVVEMARSTSFPDL